MRSLWTVILCCLTFYALPQRGKNMELIVTSERPTGTSYALVMGVSKYENPNIPELHYAHIDALVFREYLISAGIDEKNVYTLINESATNAAFWSTLNYLSDHVKEGDIVYIYFSGHGDVESKTIVQDAYLLPYDSPYTVYPMGAIGIVYLKSWISTFSAKGVQTIFIADACKSGNLIGGREGMEATANILKDKWQDEIKIVSCQPGELSLEGEQWGGGRGLFSYELINGLSGLADRNKDEQVTLRELNLYLLEKVPEQSERTPQNPILIGNYETTVSLANKGFVEMNKNSKKVIAVASKGILQSSISNSAKNEVSQKTESKSAKLYEEFNGMLKENHLISIYPPSAYSIYKELEQLNEDTKLVESAKLLLSEQIMKNIQRFVRFMISDISEKEYGQVRILQISIEATILRELLGDNKLKESGNFARVLFAESCRSIHRFVSDENFLMPKELAIYKLDSALSIDKGAVYVHCLKGMIYEFEYFDEGAALNEYKYAIAGNPNFKIARNMLLMRLSKNKDYSSILKYTEGRRNNLLNILYTYIAFKHLNVKDSTAIYLTKIQGMSHLPLNSRNEFEICQEIGSFMLEERDLENAIYYFQKALKSLDRCCTAHEKDFEMYSENVVLLNYNLACIYSLQNNAENSLNHLDASLKAGWKDFEWMFLDSDLAFVRKSKKFKLLFEKNPTVSYNIACTYAKSGREKEALEFLEIALKNGFSDYGWMKDDQDLSSIRETKEYENLVKKYSKE